MDPRRWEMIQAAFDEVVALDGIRRADRLAALDQTDPELRAAVESLLAADAQASARLAPLEGGLLGDAGTPTDPLGLAGRTVSHFQVLEPLGAGGMGVVYRGFDTRLGRPVALKFLLPHYSLDRSAKTRFLREARVAATLDHPNLCTIYDVGESEDGRLFLAMALYAGETLKIRLSRAGPLPVAEALAITGQIARGLGCAHAAGIVHRDVKPGNVMLLPDGTVKILDFGLAKALDERSAQTNALFGTVSYMAPEQIRGDVVDARADLWATGVVLYEMLTGRKPFGGEHEVAIAHAIVHEEPVAPGLLRDGLPGPVDDLVLALLEKDPGSRYALDQLLANLAAAGTLNESAVRAVRTRRLLRRLRRLPKRGWIVTVGAALIIGGVGYTAIALAFWLRGAGRGDDDHVVLRERRQVTFSGRVSSPALSDDGRLLAYVVQDCAATCTYAIELQDVGETATRRILGGAGGLGSLAWSGDRRHLLFAGVVDGRQGWYMISALGGSPRWVAPLRPFSLPVAFWGTGDSLLVAPADARDSVFWLRVTNLEGAVGDSIRIAGPGRDIKVLTVAGAPWIVVAVGREYRTIDRHGRELDRVAVPWATVIVRLSADALWLAPAGGGASYGNEVAVITRLPVNTEVGRFAARLDTVYSGASTGYDVTADGSVLVLDEGNYEYSLWALDLPGALRGAWPPERRVLTASTPIGAVVSPDGRRLAVVRELPDGNRLSIMSFAGGPETPLPGSGSLQYWADSVTIVVVEVAPGGSRLSLLDVRNGTRTAVRPIADTGLVFTAALRAGRWVWVPPLSRSIRAQRPDQQAPDTITVSDWYRSLTWLSMSPDGKRIAYTGVGASFDSVRVSVAPVDGGPATPWATLPGNGGEAIFLVDGSLALAAWADNARTLFHLREPGRLERLGTVPRPTSWWDASTDLRRLLVTARDYRADAWLSRVVRR